MGYKHYSRKKQLISATMSDEMKATIAFIQWQQCGNPPVVKMDAGLSLRVGKGVPVVILMENDVQLAVGFWDITKYWQEHGLCLC